jgi:hypothetical protein
LKSAFKTFRIITNFHSNDFFPKPSAYPISWLVQTLEKNPGVSG